MRRGGSSGRWLGARMAAFGVGAVLALLGMAMGRDGLVLAGGAVLLAGILLGLAARRLDPPDGRGPGDAPGDDPGDV